MTFSKNGQLAPAPTPVHPLQGAEGPGRAKLIFCDFSARFAPKNRVKVLALLQWKEDEI